MAKAASQMLASGSFMAPFHLLFQQHFRHLVGTQFRACLFTVNQWQHHPVPGRFALRTGLRQTAAENPGGHVAKLPAFMRSRQFLGPASSVRLKTSAEAPAAKKPHKKVGMHTGGWKNRLQVLVAVSSGPRLITHDSREGDYEFEIISFT
jgi:hypothetical protein